jgi:Serine dehydrogenase proteinase
MATDAIPYLIEQLDRIPKDAAEIDFLIASLGGEPMVAWRIMSFLHQRFEKKVSVLIPQSAYSAATLVAFGAHEIVMHPNGHIGPVDMQIEAIGEGGRKRFSTEDMSAFLDFIRDNLKITDQEHIRTLFEGISREIGPLNIGFTARTSRLASELAERLLGLHMTSDEDKAKVPSIVENMSRKYQSHGWPVNRKEAAGIGLPINKRDEKLEELMWDAWLSIEADLKENTPFYAQYEVLSHKTEGPKLLKPVPQLDLPMNPESGSYSTTIKDINDALSKAINPVDFECKLALVESARMAHTSYARGKILACRTPDLVVQWSVLTTSREWERQENVERNVKEKVKQYVKENEKK